MIIQDYLAWSDCYNCEECTFFVNLFQEIYPETIEYFKNNEWRKNNFLYAIKIDREFELSIFFMVNEAKSNLAKEINKSITYVY